MSLVERHPLIAFFVLAFALSWWAWPLYYFDLSPNPIIGFGPFLAPRLRWSGSRYDRIGDEVIRTTIRRLGKTAGAVLDALERAGGTATVGEIADALNKTRVRDLRRRTIARLEAAAVVECLGDAVSLSRDWLDALDREREVAGEITAHRRDMARYNRERQAYRQRDEIKIAPVPERPPDGEIAELKRVPDGEAPPELIAGLRRFLLRHPHRGGETPSWLAVALWAEGYLPTKPSPGAVEVALYELRAVAA